MGQQSNKIIKRRRRANYLKRKKEQAKLGGILPKAKVTKAASKAEPKDDENVAAKKAPAKTVVAKKAAAKKAPAKKATKKAPAKKAAKKAAKKSED